MKDLERMKNEDNNISVPIDKVYDYLIEKMNEISAYSQTSFDVLEKICDSNEIKFQNENGDDIPFDDFVSSKIIKYFNKNNEKLSKLK